MSVLPVQRPEFDAIYWQTVGKHVRTICVTSPNAGEGTSALASALAWRGAAAGLKVLLVDANAAHPTVSARFGLRPARWSPAGGGAHDAIQRAQGVALDVLPAPAGVDPLAFRDPESWRRLLERDLAGYELVVIDGASVNGLGDKAIPAAAAAAACAATVLVVLAGVTSERSVREAVDRLTGAGASLLGAVFNDRFNPGLADELCREIDRLARRMPRLHRALQRWVRGSAILNLQI